MTDQPRFTSTVVLGDGRNILQRSAKVVISTLIAKACANVRRAERGQIVRTDLPPGVICSCGEVEGARRPRGKLLARFIARVELVERGAAALVSR